MAGEVSGTKAILLLGDGGDYSTIVGQIELISNVGGSPIDVSSKSDDDWTRLMDGELSIKGRDISGGLVYSSAASFRAVREKQLTHSITDFLLSFNNNSEVDLYVTGIVSGMVDNLPQGQGVKTNFTINSTFNAFTSCLYVPVGSDNYLTTDSKYYQVRA